MFICLYLNKYFDIAGEIWEIQQKITMFNLFQLIINFVGKSDCISTESFLIFRDSIDILTHYKDTYFIYSHLYFAIKDEMFKLRIKRHPGGFMTLRSVNE